jgi:hypothetical protein
VTRVDPDAFCTHAMERKDTARAPEPHPTVAIVQEGVRLYGPAVYGRLGINPANDLRYEMHVLFMQFVDERSEGRQPDFGHENLDRLEGEFLEALRKDIAGLAKQLLESEPSGTETTTRSPASGAQRHPGLPRRAQRTRLWR